MASVDYKGMELTYHKTLPYSTIVEKDPKDSMTYDILYDILIKQNGDIHCELNRRDDGRGRLRPMICGG